MICSALGCTFPVSVKDVNREGEFIVIRSGCINGHDCFESCRDPDAPPERDEPTKRRHRACGSCNAPLVDRGYLYALCTTCRVRLTARRHGRRGDEKRCVICTRRFTKPSNYSWARWKAQQTCSCACAARRREGLR